MLRTGEAKKPQGRRWEGLSKLMGRSLAARNITCPREITRLSEGKYPVLSLSQRQCSLYAIQSNQDTFVWVRAKAEILKACITPESAH